MLFAGNVNERSDYNQKVNKRRESNTTDTFKWFKFTEYLTI